MKNTIKKYQGFIKYCALGLIIFVAQPIYAALTFPSNGTFSDILTYLTSILSLLIPLIIGGAVVAFLYGIFMFIAKSSMGDADGRKESINFMIFGIVGIAVMISVWGLVNFVVNTFGASNVIPQFPTSAGSQGTANFNQPGGPFGPTNH